MGDWEKAYRALEAEILRITRTWDEHPEVDGEMYDGPCECMECCSYAVADAG